MSSKHWSNFPDDILVRLSYYNKRLYTTCPVVRKKIRQATRRLSLRCLFARWQLQGYSRLESLYVLNKSNKYKIDWIPSTVRELAITYIEVDDELLSHIPSTITSLSLRKRRNHFFFDREWVGESCPIEVDDYNLELHLSSLPTSVTDCDLPLIVDNDRTMGRLHVSRFTPSKKMIEVEELIDDRRGIVYSSSTIKRLTLMGDCDVDLSRLHQLESFIHIPNPQSIEDLISVKNIPTSVTLLDIRHKDDRSLSIDHLCNLRSLRILDMKSSSLLLFPYLTELSLYYSTLRYDDLPRCLRKLSAHKVLGNGPYPTTLEELSITNSGTDSLPPSLRILSIVLDEDRDCIDLSHLHHLTDLTVSSEAGSDLYLPNSLTTLDLLSYQGNCDFTTSPESKRVIPLLHLRLHSYHDEALPDSLLTLELDDNITRKNIKKLPKRLRELRVNKVSLADVHHLPRYLAILAVEHTKDGYMKKLSSSALPPNCRVIKKNVHLPMP